MTGQEYQEFVNKWLTTIKVGDEVCVTNTKDPLRLFSNMLFGISGNNTTGNETEKNVCIITAVRGVLPDGSIVVDDHIYNKEGKREGVEMESLSTAPSLHPVTDELRETSERLDFIDAVRRIKWDIISTEAMGKIVEVIMEEEARIKEEKKQKEEEQRKAEEAKKEQSQLPAPASKLNLSTNSISHVTPMININIDEIANAVANKLKDRSDQKEDV